MAAPRWDDIEGEELTAPSFDAVEGEEIAPDETSRAAAPFGPDPAGSFAGSDAQGAGTLTPGRPPPRNPGVLRSIGSEALQGFLKGGSDEATGLVTRAAVDPGNGAAWRQPDGSTRMLNTPMDVYRAGRDTEREVLRGAEEHYPKLSFGARMVGDLASDAVAATFGLPAGSNAYNTTVGALSGVLSSDADLTTGDPEAYAWTAGNALLGGALGRYAPEVAKGIIKFTPAALRAARTWLESVAVSQGRRVLLNGADSLSNRVPTKAAAVLEAIRSGGILPFGTTQGAFKRLEGMADARGAMYGAILDDLEAAGVKGPDAVELATQLALEAEKRLAVSSSDTSVADLFQKEAQNAIQRSGADEGTTRLGLKQAEGIKRNLQSEAKYGRLEDTPMNEAKREIASTYRQAIEDEVEAAGQAAAPDSRLRELAESFKPIKDRLANTLEARNAAERGAQRVAARRGMSLSDYVAAGMGSGITEKISLGTLNNLARNRGTSAVASGAYGLSRAATAGAEAVARNPAGAAQTLGRAAVIGLRERPRQGVDTERGEQSLSDNALIENLARSSPDALGPYAQTLQQAQAEGRLSVVHYVLQQRDPEYRQLLEQAREAQR